MCFLAWLLYDHLTSGCPQMLSLAISPPNTPDSPILTIPPHLGHPGASRDYYSLGIFVVERRDGMMGHVIMFMVGKYRLMRSLCPKCASDAPDLDDCNVCFSYHQARGDKFPPSDSVKRVWWVRFMAALSFH